MAKYDMFSKVKIEIKGQLFDIGEVYKHAHDWLEWRKFDVVEKKYVEKSKPSGREMQVEWSATRDIDEYSRFEIDVEWEMYGINDVKMKHEGKEAKLQTGNVVIRISAILVMDYDAKWETSRFHKFLQAFFEKYLYTGTIESLKGELWREGWDFYNEMKAYLNLYQF
jgi:hypothetical protein